MPRCENQRAHDRQTQRHVSTNSASPSVLRCRTGSRRRFRRIVPLQRRYCRLEPLSAAKHARDVYRSPERGHDGHTLDLFVPRPFDDFAAYEAWCAGAEASRDPQFYAIVDGASGRAVGTCTNMRIEPRHGVIEVGNIYFPPRLSRTRARDRGHVPPDGERVRPWVSPLRMEMR